MAQVTRIQIPYLTPNNMTKTKVPLMSADNLVNLINRNKKKDRVVSARLIPNFYKLKTGDILILKGCQKVHFVGVCDFCTFWARHVDTPGVTFPADWKDYIRKLR